MKMLSRWDYSQMNAYFSFQCFLRNIDVSGDYIVTPYPLVQHLEQELLVNKRRKYSNY